MASLGGVTFDNYTFERLNMILLLEIIPEPAAGSTRLPTRNTRKCYKKILLRIGKAIFFTKYFYRKTLHISTAALISCDLYISVKWTGIMLGINNKFS